MSDKSLKKSRFIEMFGDRKLHKTKKLKDVSIFYSGTGFPTKYQNNPNGEYPFYKVGDISRTFQSGQKYITVADNYVNSDIVRLIKGTIIPSNTVVFAKIGEALKLNRRSITTSDCLIDNNAMGIKPKQDFLNPIYFYQVMLNIDMKLYSSGTTAPSVRKSALEDIEITIPNIKLQNEYAFFSEQIDKSKVILQKLLEKLELLKKSRFIEMFGELNTNTKGYPVKKLSSIAEYWNGLTYKPIDIVDEGGTLVLRSGNIQKGNLSFLDNVYVNCKISEKLLVKENDILMCSRNGSAALVGKTALIKGLTKPTTFGAFMMVIRSLYYPYLKAYFDMPYFRNKLSVKTSTINQITGKMLNEIEIPVPYLDEVHEFELFVQQIDKSKVTILISFKNSNP